MLKHELYTYHQKERDDDVKTVHLPHRQEENSDSEKLRVSYVWPYYSIIPVLAFNISTSEIHLNLRRSFLTLYIRAYSSLSLSLWSFYLGPLGAVHVCYTRTLAGVSEAIKSWGGGKWGDQCYAFFQE